MIKVQRFNPIRCLLLTSIIFVCSLLTLRIIIINRNIEITIDEVIYFPPGKQPPEDWRKLDADQMDALSGLGRYLYLDETPFFGRSNQSYIILIWKYGETLEKRHMKHFTDKSFDPLEVCSVKNCLVTYDPLLVSKADAVLFHMQRMRGIIDLPPSSVRKPHQRWVWLTDETPFHTFLNGDVFLEDFDGIFNWSMTYRMNSDVPVPYGRTVRRPTPVGISLDFDKRSDVLIAIMGSNCGGENKRWEYVDELKKHIEVHVYGQCGNHKCPGHFDADCNKLNQYKFYLSFENSNCPEYITEKLWWNAYSKNAIPIVMGCSRKEFKQLLPPNSYLDVDEFARPVDLARFIYYINRTKSVYHSYFRWKHYFEVKNEHGYFKTQSYHYCRLCEALNYNSLRSKVYWNLTDFWDRSQCYASWDVPNAETAKEIYIDTGVG